MHSNSMRTSSLVPRPNAQLFKKGGGAWGRGCAYSCYLHTYIHVRHLAALLYNIYHTQESCQEKEPRSKRESHDTQAEDGDEEEAKSRPRS